MPWLAPEPAPAAAAAMLCHMPNCASSRGRRSPGSALICGSARWSRRSPSSESASVAGLARGEQYDSTAWSTARMPVAWSSQSGVSSVAAGSSTTWRGTRRRWVNDCLAWVPDSVTPAVAVNSDADSVVDTAIMRIGSAGGSIGRATWAAAPARYGSIASGASSPSHRHSCAALVGVDHRAAADGDQHLGLRRARRGGHGDHVLARAVRADLGEAAGVARSERPHDALERAVGEPAKRAGRHHEDPPRVVAVDLGDHGRIGGPAEHHALLRRDDEHAAWEIVRRGHGAEH